MPHRRRAQRAARGFTLIELIVVVIIIAVLAAIGAVAYNQYASRARSNAVLASAASLRTAVMAASARDDLAPATEVDALWNAAGGDSGVFLRSLSSAYTGPVTYLPAVAGVAASLQVGAAGGGTHAACLRLPDVVSLPVTVAAGACTGLQTDPSPSPGSSSSTAPATTAPSSSDPSSPDPSPSSSSSAPAAVAYQQAVLADGPRMFYPMNDPAGSTSAPSLVPGTGGTYTGGTLTAATRPDGSGAGTVWVSAGTQTGLVAAAPGSGWGPRTSVELWFRGAPSVTARIDLFGEAAMTEYYSMFDVTGSTIKYRLYGGAAVQVSGTDVNDGNWHMLDVTADNSSGSNVIAAYLDGQPVTGAGASDSSPSVVHAATELRFGTSTGFAMAAGTALADASVYPSVLSPAQVAAHYAAATS